MNSRKYRYYIEFPPINLTAYIYRVSFHRVLYSVYNENKLSKISTHLLLPSLIIGKNRCVKSPIPFSSYIALRATIKKALLLQQQQQPLCNEISILLLLLLLLLGSTKKSRSNTCHIYIYIERRFNFITGCIPACVKRRAHVVYIRSSEENGLHMSCSTHVDIALCVYIYIYI